MSKYPQIYEFKNNLLYDFIGGRLDPTFTTYDLGWWLECKTDEQFTVIQVQIVKDMFKLLELQKEQIEAFKAILTNNLDYLKRKLDPEAFLADNKKW